MVCVNILSAVIKRQTDLVYLEKLRTHTHAPRQTRQREREREFFPIPQSELVVEEAERECVYLLCESLCNCKEEFVAEWRGERWSGEGRGAE